MSTKTVQRKHVKNISDAQRQAYWRLQQEGPIGQGTGVSITTARRLVDLGLATLDQWMATGETRKADRVLTWVIKSVPEADEPPTAHRAMRRLPVFESLTRGLTR